MFKITTETTTAFDLAALPFKDWPEQARAMARTIVALRHREFDAMFPELRKCWVVQHIYRLQDLYNRPLSDFF